MSESRTPDQLLTTRQLAEQLGVTVGRIRQLKLTGAIRPWYDDGDRVVLWNAGTVLPVDGRKKLGKSC